MILLSRWLRTACFTNSGITISHPSLTKGIRFSQSKVNVQNNLTEILPPSLTNDNSPKKYPPHIHELVDRISSLTLLEVSDLSELLQKRLNISASAFMPVTPQVKNTESTDEPEDQPISKISFSVKLSKFDPAKKIQIIKEIKQLVPDMNLVQAKKFVEAAPGVIKDNVTKEEAEEIKKTLEAVGAQIEIE